MTGLEFGVGITVIVLLAVVAALKVDGGFQKCKKCGSRMTTTRSTNRMYAKYIHCWRCGANVWPPPWHLMNPPD